MAPRVAQLPGHEALLPHSPDQPVTPCSHSTTRPVEMPLDASPVLFVVVDTEEEFDWTAPFSRDATRVTSIPHVKRLQRVTATYGVVPTYVIDYPVATNAEAAEILAELADAGECRIGAHLHPWVNPPFSEELCAENSYGCNLEPRLEARKIQILKDAIAEHLGIDTRVYKAGRYGFGPSTARTLEALDFDVDLSVNPGMDFTADGGPSFTGCDARPFTFGATRTLLEIPCSTGFTGVGRAVGDRLHAVASSASGLKVHLPGVFARLGIVNKVMLSPEGFTLSEMKMLATGLYHDGVRTFSLTFHSPSLAPGNTAYARTAAEVNQLIDTIDRFLDFFLGRLGGVPGRPLDLFDKVCGSQR